MENPFISHADWKKAKTQHGIPDKVVKYSFGEKMESLNKRFLASDLRNTSAPRMTLVQAQFLMELITEGEKLLKEYKAAVDKRPSSDFKNKSKVIDFLAERQKFLGTMKIAADKIKDPFLNSRKMHEEARALFALAVKNPLDHTALSHMYAQGMRNHMGADINAAKKLGIGDTELHGLIDQYQTLVVKWLGPMAAPAVVASDKAKAMELIKDMAAAMKIGESILRKTAA